MAQQERTNCSAISWLVERISKTILVRSRAQRFYLEVMSSIHGVAKINLQSKAVMAEYLHHIGSQTLLQKSSIRKCEKAQQCANTLGLVILGRESYQWILGPCLIINESPIIYNMISDRLTLEFLCGLIYIARPFFSPYVVCYCAWQEIFMLHVL